MRVGYVDTSYLVAIVFDEPDGAGLARTLSGFDETFSSNLLEAELRASCSREDVVWSDAHLGRLTWVLPDRPLSDEIRTVLSTAYLRGADLWHIACALYLAGDPNKVSFLTLDGRQAEVADALGFAAGPG